LLQSDIAKKITKTFIFGNLRSFKVIDVDKSKKPVTSACYDKQHVCTYLQRFSHQRYRNCMPASLRIHTAYRVIKWDHN